MTSIRLASVADAFAALDHATAQVVAGEVGQVMAIAAACDLHRVDETVLVAGAERWLPGGADGTPDIGEFVAGEVGAVLGISPASAVARIADVLNVRHRHPALWGAVLAGDVRFHEAARIAQACVAAGLDAEACGFVDRQCAIALAMQPWSRVRGRVESWVILADPARAAERERAAAETRHLGVGGFVDGHCDLWGRLDAADGLDLDHALGAIAKTLPADTPLDHRRAAAVGALARQALGQAELPRSADVVVRIDATAAAGGGLDLAAVAHVQGWGAILTDRLRSLLSGSRVTVRPIVDAQRLSPSDAYRLPPSMRRVLVERWAVDAFPFGSRKASGCEGDHTVPFDHDAEPGHGQTHPDAMAPLSSFTHRMKTHGGWTCEQPEPGLLLWTSPHGWAYAVTPSGTVRVGRPPPRDHAWWRQEPPDWLDDGSDAPPADVDPGPSRPPLALHWTRDAA